MRSHPGNPVTPPTQPPSPPFAFAVSTWPSLSVPTLSTPPSYPLTGRALLGAESRKTHSSSRYSTAAEKKQA